MNNSSEFEEVDLLVKKARIAQEKFEKQGSQQLFDLACQAVGWALMEPEHNQRLAELAVKETGLGNVSDKIKKNHNKTLGL
jgi:sulfoacetaldehyde dehydrogenase